MSTIPLPALDVKPPEQQPSLIGQYAQLQALKNQQVMQPLQQQAAQQSVQSGQLELQQQQQDLKDQQGISKWFMNIDPNDPDAFNPQKVGKTLAQSGVSGKGIMAAQQQLLQHQQTALTMTKDQLSNQQEMANQVYQGVNGIIGVTDPQARAQALTQLLPTAVQAKALTPQQAQQMMQNPAAVTDDQLKQFQHGLGVSSAFLASVARMQTAQTGEQKLPGEIQAQNLNNQKLQGESNFYQQNGGAPGVPAELMQQADWLSKNPGKGASDFLAWKAKQTPNAMVMGNMFGGAPGGTQDAGLDLAAQNYRLTGQLPAGLTRSPGSTKAIIDRAAQLDQQGGGEGIAANKLNVQSLGESLKSVQKNASQVQAFENTALKNMDLLDQTAQKIPDLGTRFANVPIRMITGNMIGTTNMAAFKTALATAQTEAAKVLNSSNATGVLSDSARHELQDLIDGNATYPALKASLATLKSDMNNRSSAYAQQITDLQQRIKGVGAGSANPGQQGQPNANDPFSQFGGKAH